MGIARRVLRLALLPLTALLLLPLPLPPPLPLPTTLAPMRPALALPPRPALRRGLWALPLLLSLAFVVAVLTWLRASEHAERDEQRTELITDTLSLEAQFSTRIEREAALLAELARSLEHSGRAPSALSAAPQVQLGLHRFWVSITWLDARNQIVAHLPELAAAAAADIRPALPPAPWSRSTPSAQATHTSGSGLSAHLNARLASGGALVVRYSPIELLRQTVPWWLARKYDVRLVDSFGDVIASTVDGAVPADRQMHRISLAPTLSDAWLELSARDRVAPWYRSFPMPMVAGFVVLIAAITWMLRRQVHDVSHAEEAWRSEAAWRRAMEESLTVGLRARDLEGRLIYVNRALVDLLGWSADELVGRKPPMPYWPPDDAALTMQRHERNMAGQAPRGGYESRWQHRDGRAIDVMLFEAPLVDARGQQVGWMGSIVDITQAKRLAERERQGIETMTHHARLTMLGEVAATLAHELNQPLSAIASYTAGALNSLQRADLAVPTEPLVLRALQRLGEQAAHAGRIVQRIREFLTRREPRLEASGANAIVTGAVTLLERELERRRVRLTLRLAAGLPEVIADAVLIEQVVINLLRNASDALSEPVSAPGNAPATHHATGRRIELRTVLSPDRRFVRIVVTDNGPGLLGRSVATLCAPFYSTRVDGMGMGLAICRSIVEAHHGVLDACEAPDSSASGACFSLTLPVRMSGVGAA